MAKCDGWCDVVVISFVLVDAPAGCSVVVSYVATNCTWWIFMYVLSYEVLVLVS